LGFSYMLILEASDYNRYKNEGQCIKPFGLFWIGDFLSILMFRLFYYLEKYFHYRLVLASFERDDVRVRRARLLAISICLKLLAYSGFLVFTIIGSVWFVQDGKCLNNMDKNSDMRAEVQMVFWLLVSFTVCLIYLTRILRRQIFEDFPMWMLQRNDNGQFNVFILTDQVRRQGGRNLTEMELNEIKKSKLCSYDELSRFAKAPSTSSQKIPHELDTLSSNEPVPLSEEPELFNEPELKRDEEESQQYSCAVCLEDIKIGEWYKKLPKCAHCFHASCIDQWLSKRATCPVCREEIFLHEDSLERSVAVRGNAQVQGAQGEAPIGLVPINREPRIVLRLSRVMS